MWPLIAVGALCTVHVINLIILDREQLNLNLEGSAITFVAAAFFAMAGVFALARATRAERYRAGWAVLGLGGTLFALEEGGLMLHERFEEATSTGLGLILAVVFAVILLALIIRSGSASLPAPAPRVLVAAASALVISQLLGGAATRADQSPLKDVLAVGEECGEALVAALMMAAVLSVSSRATSRPPSSEG